MFLECHILQNFAPSNLNRSDTNAPKDCEFGGYRRARISSQCLKRAIRTTFKGEQLLTADDRLAVRTKRLLETLTARLKAAGRPDDQAESVAIAALGGMGIGLKAEKTQYLLFLGATEIERISALCDQHWDALAQVAAKASEEEEASTKGRSAKENKKAGKQAVPDAVSNALKAVLDGGKAADLALFGRMLADLPDKNVDAACQVAHALSTNRISMEFDFYTAVDDLKPDDTSGADMLGTIEFNSACFYRYANVDIGTLVSNLGGDLELARETLRAFLLASVRAIPTGKQNSMAAQNPPSFVMTVVRERGLWSLANAFLKPIAPGQDGDLVERSVRALNDYWSKLVTMYGAQGLAGAWAVSLDGVGHTSPTSTHVQDIDTLVARTMATAFPTDTTQ